MSDTLYLHNVFIVKLFLRNCWLAAHLMKYFTCILYDERKVARKILCNSREFRETFHTTIAGIFLLFFTDILKHHLLSRMGAWEFQELPFSFEKFFI